MSHSTAALGIHFTLSSLLHSCNKNKKEILPEITDVIKTFLEEATGKLNVYIVGGQKCIDKDMFLKSIYIKDSDKWSYGFVIKE